MEKYQDVMVIKTGKNGLVVDTNGESSLVDFGDSKAWYDNNDLVEIDIEIDD